ncbi:hypothetical protein EJ110_NYTH00169 [Nymphaea thermarum]|nr:hypothetical protein EJ110_NYTH00169 [Nymphaea thermarum]
MQQSNRLSMWWLDHKLGWEEWQKYRSKASFSVVSLIDRTWTSMALKNLERKDVNHHGGIAMMDAEATA